MKRILLTSTALVAFAGAAAAEVTFKGDAEFGHNDDLENGFYWSLGLTLGGSMELDNGLTAAISGDVEINNAADSTFNGNEVTIDDATVSLSSDSASLIFGDTKSAAENMFSGVTNVKYDGFLETGDVDDDANNVDGVLRGKYKVGDLEMGVSYFVRDTDALPDDDLKALQVVANYNAGAYNFSFAYQADDTNVYDLANGGSADVPEIIALSAGTTLGGADVKLTYADTDGSGTSIGVGTSYTIGDVKVGAFFVSNDADTGSVDDNYGVSVSYTLGDIKIDALYHDGDDEDLQVNVAYDMGNGLNLFAGYRDEGENSAGMQQGEIIYAGADYDLGGGATARLSYVDVGDKNRANLDTDPDEFGPGENLKEGTTVEVSFKF